MADKKQEKTESKNLFDRSTPLLVVAVVAMAFAIGALWQRVTFLQKGSSPESGVKSAQAPTAAAQPQAPASGKLLDSQAQNFPKPSSEDHILGSLDADILLVEYSDYSCPFCVRFHPTAQQLLEEYQGQVAWVYRHFPLDALHPNARPIAEISECVASLGGEDAFWAFTDAVYTDEPADSAAAIDLAASEGVSKDDLQSCFDEGRFSDKVESQYQVGLQAGVTGTPGNFIINKDGEIWKLPGAVPFENLSSVVDEALGN